MKKRIYMLVAVLCVSLLAITACSSNGSKNNGATDKNATESPDMNDTSTKTDSDGDGVKDSIDNIGDAIESLMPDHTVAPETNTSTAPEDTGMNAEGTMAPR